MSFGFKRIAIPLDGSMLAEQSLALVPELIDPNEGNVHLLQVCDLPLQMFDDGGAVYVELLMASQKTAAAYLEKASKLVASGIAVQTSQLTGHVIDILLDETKSLKCDLVIMTSQGKSGLERMLLGTVAEGFARRSECPVLILRGGPVTPNSLGKRILVPLDGSALAEAILPYAYAMAQRYQGEVVLLRSYSDNDQHSPEFDGHDLYPNIDLTSNPSREVKTYLDSKVQELGQRYPDIKTSLVTSTKNAAEAILLCCQTQHFDLVCMTSHGATGLSRWIFGSVAERVLRHLLCPILLFRNS